MRNPGLEEAKPEIKIDGRNINNLRYADDTTLMSESEEELKSFLMKVKEEGEKDGETVERVSDLILGAPKSLQMVTAAMKLKDAYFLEGKL